MSFINETVFIDGIFSWARVVQAEEFTDPETGKVDRFWSITIHPTNESLEIIRDLQARGIMNKMKKNDDGYYIKFKRPTEKKRKGGGKILLEAPLCLNSEKQPIDGMTIGNGSSGRIKLEVYGATTPRRYLAARLDSVMVKDLKEYEPTRDLNSEDRNRTEGFDDRPQPDGWD